MKSYLIKNHKLWQKSYSAPNVENVIFRLQGRILKKQYNVVASTLFKNDDYY